MPAFHCLQRCIALICAFATVGLDAAKAEISLVSDGRATSVIVVQDANDAFAQMAAVEFQKHIQRASDAKLPIVSVAEAEKLPARTARVVIGGGPLAQQCGVDVEQLAPEQFRLKTDGNSLVLVGRDTGRHVAGRTG